MKCLAATTVNITNNGTSKIAQDSSVDTHKIIDWIHIISFIGSILNFGIIINLIFANTFYKSFNFIRCRSICNLLVCILGNFFVTLPERDCVGDYATIYRYMYMFNRPLRIALFASIVSDILLILNRKASLYEENESVFYTLSKKVNLFICYTIPIILNLPFYLAVEVVKLSNSPNETRGYWTLNEFGKTKFFGVYALVIILLEFVIPLAMLIVLNLKSLIIFRRMLGMLANRRADQETRRFLDFNTRFTKLVIILTFICILTRTFDMMVNLGHRAVLLFFPDASDELVELFLFLRTVNFLVLITAHAFDGLFYYLYDAKMRNLLGKYCTFSVRFSCSLKF